MRATCPNCGEQSHITSFFVEDEGKRLAVCLAEMEPVLGRAVIGYLGLFKPTKTSLRLARAAKIAQEVAELAAEGSVCKDERGGIRRQASASLWAAGIDVMLQQRASLALPLETHGYLRAVVFGLADKAEAAAERKVEEDRRAVSTRPGETSKSKRVLESRLQTQLNWVNQQLHYGNMTEQQADIERKNATQKYGANHEHECG